MIAVKKSEELHSCDSKMETFSNQTRSLERYAFRRIPTGLTGNGMSLIRGISTSSGEANVSIASVFEVDIAASDSTFPVAAVQYLIDGVHTLTGLNWWASIAVATLLVGGAVVPLYIKVLRKHFLKLKLMIAQSTMVTRQVKAAGLDPLVLEEGILKIIIIFIKCGILPIMAVSVEGSIFSTFFFAVLNVAEKVHSFKTEGTLWFTDLSTPDAMYIFPIQSQSYL